MSEAQQWIMDLMADDVGLLVGGLTLLILTIELIARFREWLS